MQPSIIKRARVVVEHGPATSETTAGARSTARCAKKASVLEHGGIVRGIEITCSCGESTIVEFVTAEPQGGKPS